MDVVIPATLGGRRTIAIAEYAFAYMGVTSVVIPNSVNSIGDSAFSTDGLTSVTIPDSVTTIGASAFDINPLTSLTLGASVVTIGDRAFNHDWLTTVTIPDSVTTIGNYAFADNALASAILGNSVTTIGEFAFYMNHLTSLTPPASLTAVGDAPFSGNALASVRMEGDEPTTLGGPIFDVVSAGNDPLVTFHAGANYTHGLAGYWLARFANYRVQDEATVTFSTPVGLAPSAVNLVVLNVIDGITDATVAQPGPLVADAHRFLGWYDAPTGGNPVTFPLTVAADTNLYAHWTSLFNVTYTTAYSVAPASVVIPDGGTLASPGSLTATGYRFDGWFTAASGGTLVTFPVNLTGDLTLYAQWTPEVTATFSSPVGTAPVPVAVTIGDTLPNPGPLTADVHRFLGWYDAPAGGHLIAFLLTVATDTAIYAQWEARDVIAPASADAGTTIAVTGTGFEPGESVAIELHSDPVLLGTVIANGSGAISGTFTIPAAVAAGSHSLVLTGSVTGVSSGGIAIGGPLAFTGTNPVPLGLGAVALIGIGLILRRRNPH